MENTHEFSEVSQLRTRCSILESQVEVLQKQNADLKATITILHPDQVGSQDSNMKQKWTEVPKVGKFPRDDEDFQV